MDTNVLFAILGVLGIVGIVAMVAISGHVRLRLRSGKDLDFAVDPESSRAIDQPHVDKLRERERRPRRS